MTPPLLCQIIEKILYIDETSLPYLAMTLPPLRLFKKKNWYIPISDFSVLKKKMVWKIRYYKKQFSKLKSFAQRKGDSKDSGKKKWNLQNSLLRLYRYKVFGFYICNFQNKKVYKLNYHYLNNHKFRIINFYFYFDHNVGSVGVATPLCLGDIWSNLGFQIRDLDHIN